MTKLIWRKGRCEAQNCVEAAAPNWRKASYSATNGACVEVDDAQPAVVRVRDSKLGDASPILTFHPAAWQDLIGAIQSGRLVGA